METASIIAAQGAGSVDLDDSLAVLSIRAAQEIDRRLKGRDSDPAILVQFGAAISRATGLGDAEPTSLLQVDPSTTEVISRAVEETANESVSDIDALAHRMREIIVPLTEKSDNWSPQELRQVKAFCLAFHRALMTQWAPATEEGDYSFDDEFRFVG